MLLFSHLGNSCFFLFLILLSLGWDCFIFLSLSLEKCLWYMLTRAVWIRLWLHSVPKTLYNFLCYKWPSVKSFSVIVVVYWVGEQAHCFLRRWGCVGSGGSRRLLEACLLPKHCALVHMGEGWHKRCLPSSSTPSLWAIWWRLWCSFVLHPQTQTSLTLLLSLSATLQFCAERERNCSSCKPKLEATSLAGLQSSLTTQERQPSGCPHKFSVAAVAAVSAVMCGRGGEIPLSALGLENRHCSSCGRGFAHLQSGA